MGIPKFFRYITERYPCLTERLKDYQIPKFDNLYLDVNGIIHQCSHPDDTDILFRITEETVFKNIFRYIELLFNMIQPQKLFFIAIDGVAPRAKINQQRCRRFKVAKDAQIQEAKARAKNKTLPKEKKFDSNCITPGTLFMSKLDEHLKYFITYKISNDKLWQNCKIIFSGSQVPGEGEHKIMDYIRYMKAQPNYDIHTKHCLYGLDADLIMLGLCTHEIHFTLLREVLLFGKRSKKVCLTPEETEFCLFHLSLLREYIDHEFSLLKEKLSFPYDLEKIIDDWILMGFLIGNDFIPHLPNLHIRHGALSILYQVYMDILPTLDGYINESGTLRLDRFEKFMEELSHFDMLQFSEYCGALKCLETKTGRSLAETEKLNNKKSENSDKAPSPKKTPDKEYINLLKSVEEMSLGRYDDEDDGDDESDSEICAMEFVQHKKDYYMNKLKYENIDEEFLRSQAEGYVRAIQWILNYYYNGCCSWSWYYPHHYAPYTSDIKGFKDLKLEFDLGEPFLPLEQLLATLPPYSKECLPPAFQTLLTEEQSPIISYYPVEFETDLNGKEHEWESVVLIPFIDEKSLLDAMTPYYSKLTPEEQARNRHLPMCIFTYTEENLGFYKAPEHFPDTISHAKLQLVNHEDILVPREKLVRGLCPGVQLDVYYPGFSTLQHIKHTTSLEKNKKQLHRETMILHVNSPPKTNLTTVVSKLLGKTVFVNWPHLKEALVVEVSNCSTKLNLTTEQKQLHETVNEEEWNTIKKTITEIYKDTLGVEIGETKFLIRVRLLIGKKHVFDSRGKVHIEKQWADKPMYYAYQTVVKDIAVHYSNEPIYKTVNSVFKPGTVCFMLGHPYYGAMGKVGDPAVCKKSGRIKVSVVTMREPSFDEIKQIQANFETQFMNGTTASKRLGISPFLVSKITGTIFVKESSDGQQDETTHNIGLNLKFNKKNAEIPGYTRKTQNGRWFYSPNTVDLIRRYMLKCPNLFERLAQNPTTQIFQEEDLFTKGSEELSDALAWLEEQLRGIEIRACGTKAVESSIVKKLEEEVAAYLKTPNNVGKVVEMQVQPYLLYLPSLCVRNLPPDSKAKTRLFDRICCTKNDFTVPLGYKGTVIGIEKPENVTDNMYDILFDKPFVGGLSIYESSEFRAYRLSASDFINISYGERIEHGKGPLDTEPVEQWNFMANQDVQLRPNVGAFASYKNQNYLPVEVLMSPKPRIIQKNAGGVSNQLIHKFKQCNPQNIGTVREPYKLPKNAQPSENTQKNQLMEPTSEFQAIWNELHKKQELNKPMPQAPTGFKTKLVAKGFPESSPQDPSAFLKAVLKIPDVNAQQPIKQPVQQPVQPGVSRTPERSNNPQKENKTLDTPPLVQQLFDHARQNEKVKDDKTPIWYCSQLLNYYQLSGVGMPRYSYFANAENNLVQAHILLPDKRIFVGDPCVNHEQAAGSAAKKVYTELKLANLLPNMKILLPPPQNWYYNPPNSNWSTNMRPPAVPYYPTEPKLQLFPEWIQKNHRSTGSQSTVMQNNRYKHNMLSKTVHNEPKSETKKCPTPFVPLQAQKKSRHITAKQTGGKDNANQSVKDNPQPAIQQKKKELPAKTTKAEAATITVEKQIPVQSSSHQVQNTQTAIKPKKSRVAAKFCIPSQTEENNHSKSST